MLKFNSIKGQGFGSLIKPFVFKFSNPGLKIIKGENGSGKTTSISLMCWALYGQTLKGKNPETWKHVRPKKWKGTLGEVNFNTDNGEFTVIRCKKWKGEVDGARGDDGLYLFKNGKNISKHDKRSTQAAIIEELGMSFDLFKNSIMFGQKMKRIINESGPIQSKVFEEAFEAEFINIAKSNAEEERAKLQIDINEIEKSITAVDSMLIQTKQQIKAQKDLIKQFKDNKENRVLLIRKEIKETEKEITKLDKTKDYSSKITQLNHLYSEMEVDVEKRSKLETKLKESESQREESILKIGQISRVCDKCGAEVSKDKVASQISAIEKVKTQNGQDIVKLKIKIKKLDHTNEDLEELEDKIDKIEKKQYRKKLNDKQISKLLSKNVLRKQEVDKIGEESVDGKLLKRAKKSKKGLRVKMVKLKDELAIYEDQYDILQWCIKEPLSNKGLKAYIFDNQLSAVNERLDALSDILPFRIEFGIDTDTKSKKFYTLVEMSGGVVEYEDLSGGEQQLVNIAIAFSIHDVVSEDVNALFMDEVFESLDVKNIEIVGDMIMQKSDTKEVLLVTHTSFYPTGAEIINYTKSSKGATKIS